MDFNDNRTSHPSILLDYTDPKRWRLVVLEIPARDKQMIMFRKEDGGEPDLMFFRVPIPWTYVVAYAVGGTKSDGSANFKFVNVHVAPHKIDSIDDTTYQPFYLNINAHMHNKFYPCIYNISSIGGVDQELADNMMNVWWGASHTDHYEATLVDSPACMKIRNAALTKTTVDKLVSSENADAWARFKEKYPNYTHGNRKERNNLAYLSEWEELSFEDVLGDNVITSTPSTMRTEIVRYGIQLPDNIGKKKKLAAIRRR